jgi:hypothetical protein
VVLYVWDRTCSRGVALEQGPFPEELAGVFAEDVGIPVRAPEDLARAVTILAAAISLQWGWKLRTLPRTRAFAAGTGSYVILIWRYARDLHCRDARNRRAALSGPPNRGPERPALRNQSAHDRVGDAVLSVFEVPRQVIREARIGIHRDRQVVPAAGARQRPGFRFGLAGVEHQLRVA